MAIYFSNTLSKEPFQFDSVGNHWLQGKRSAVHKVTQSITICRQKKAVAFSQLTEKNIFCLKITAF